jgi:Ni,Fe-hydrogenase III component G
MSKLISFVGYSRVAGELKFRTATDEKRIEQLAKLGDTDINMVALPEAMTKSAAAKWALTAEFFTQSTECGQDVFSLFTANAKDENPFTAPKAKKEVKVRVKVAKPAKRPESRELSARELAAMQFISFPVGNSGRALYPNPLMKVSAAQDEEAV